MMDPPLKKPLYIHATAVLIGAAGLLIRGPSRAGKSSLALALLAEAARIPRFGKLIGDDRVSIENHGGILVLRGHPAIAGKIEQRGVGILDVPWISSAHATHVIDLAQHETPHVVLEAITCIEDVVLPRMALPGGRTAAENAKFVVGLITQAEDGRSRPFFQLTHPV